MNSTLKLWRKLSAYPGGKRLFSRAICIKAPYFSTISPQFEQLDVGAAIVRIKERRGLHNHLGSVHAIALCNLAEVAGGLACEVSMPEGMRWIPSGMTVKYKARAKGELRGYATVPTVEPGKKAELPVTVDVKNSDGESVFEAEIVMYVSPAKSA
ncbi:hotdog fold domain-containing protein [Spongiibacter tropicus]|uniref:hotdog fold domain-containing protein n=1 Tax=Spongiibacter tropicus TaxID=454602 RepID=UPI0023578845|nr:hotdog fold domain-containing protein [Spongiibacter tropicus]